MNDTGRVMEVLGVLVYAASFAALAAGWVLCVRTWFGATLTYFAVAVVPIFVVGYVSLVALAELL